MEAAVVTKYVLPELLENQGSLLLVVPPEEAHAFAVRRQSAAWIFYLLAHFCNYCAEIWAPL
jgi:hypothetical protein